MSDSFVPMGPAMTSASGNGFTPLQLKSALSAALISQPSANGKAPSGQDGARNGGVSSPLSVATSSNCSQPKITLQREGEVVSRIRIQCTCGQVIELDCTY